MPTKLAIDHESKTVYCTYYGDVVTDELVRHIALIRAHADFNLQFQELIDATDVTSFDVSSEEVRNLASGDSPFDPSANPVFVASADLVFGLARMFQTLGGESRPHFAVVHRRSDAYQRLRSAPGAESAITRLPPMLD